MKKLLIFLPLALILCFMVSCQDQEAVAEIEAMKAQAEIEEQNKEIVKSLIGELNKGNVEIFRELCAPDYRLYYPSNSPKPISREEIAESIKMFLRPFPDFNWSIEELIAKGDRVITRFSMRGTHEGEYQGIPATGNKVEASSIITIRIKNGKIVEMREEFDMLGFMQQLGMELKPKEGKK